MFSGPFGQMYVRDSGGSGSPIVFVHGNSSSSRAYERQFEGALSRAHRLIAYDLLGHGRSDNAVDASAYLFPSHARALLALVETFGLQEAVFVGWSLGGHILLEAAPGLPRARGLAIFGTPPVDFPPSLEGAFLPNPVLGVGLAADVTREQAQAYVGSWFAPEFVDVPAFFLENALRTDGRARAMVAASIDPKISRDEIEVVANLKTPLAILHGAKEQLVNPGYFALLNMPTLWRGAVHQFADAGHTPQWETPAAFDAAIAAFAADCGAD